jgi:hypothetical protein
LELAMAKCDPALGEIVRGQLHRDFVSRENPDAITAKATGEMSKDHLVMVQLNAEQSAGKLLQDRSGNFDAIFFTQCFSSVPIVSDPAASRATERSAAGRHATGLRRRGHISGLQALGSFRHFELNAGSFIERPIPVGLDGAKMDEHVFAALALDEAKSLGCIKPLHCAFFSHAASFSITANFLLAVLSNPARANRRRSVKSPERNPATRHHWICRVL